MILGMGTKAYSFQEVRAKRHILLVCSQLNPLFYVLQSIVFRLLIIVMIGLRLSKQL